jgi:hypothetical protein
MQSLNKCWLAGCCLLFSTLFSVVGLADNEDTESTKADIELGLAAVESGEFAKAFKYFLPLAEAGNAEAQHNLAMLYRTGKGVEKDLEASGVWFWRAANQGIADAQYYLGYMYEKGEGVEQNNQYALVWYRKAAEQGQGLAQINLGVMYANGVGVAQDVEQAYLWFHAAATQGYAAGFENKKIIEETLSAEQIESVQKRAREHYQKYVMPFQRPPSPHDPRR